MRPETPVTTIFISHGENERTTASALRQRLQALFGDRVAIHLALVPTPGTGTDRRRWFRERMGGHNLLLLLACTPPLRWDRHLYDTGVFEGMGYSRIMLIHALEAVLPPPLRHVTGIPATPPALTGFLTELCGGRGRFQDWPPLNSQLAAEPVRLAEESKRIARLLAGGRAKRQTGEEKAMTEESLENSATESVESDESQPENDQIHVFISHKAGDEKAAKALRKSLKPYSDRLKFYLSEEIPAGTDWREWIFEHLGNANLLFFLCTKPTSNWDWCLYETGIFEGIHKGRIVVLHSPEGQPPEPLNHLQSVPATQERIRDFLKAFFGTGDITGHPRPLSKGVAEDEELLDKMSSDIADLFAQVAIPERPQYFHRHLAVRVRDTETFRQDAFPTDVELDADKATLELLGLGEKPGRGHWNWNEVTQQERVNGELVKHLEDVIGRAGRGELIGQAEHTFQGPRGSRSYQPVLYRLDVGADLSQTFSSLFIEQPVKTTADFAPPEHATLLSSVTLASRLHWEVFDRFTRAVQGWNGDEEIDEGCTELKDALRNIQREADMRRQAEMRSTPQGDRLRWAFDSAEDRNAVDQNLAAQEKRKKALMEAIGEKNAEMIATLLQELRQLNGELVVMVCSRYKTLLERDMISTLQTAPAHGSAAGERSHPRH